MDPGVRRSDLASGREVLLKELQPALRAEDPFQLGPLFRFRRHALFSIGLALANAPTSCSAMARASSGGTAFPTWRYLEWAAPPSIRPGSSPDRGSVVNVNRSGKDCRRANSRTLNARGYR